VFYACERQESSQLKQILKQEKLISVVFFLLSCAMGHPKNIYLQFQLISFDPRSFLRVA
jgi:hypothetical protein